MNPEAPAKSDAKTAKTGLWTHGPVDILLVLYVLGLFVGLGAWLWYSAQIPIVWNAVICAFAGFLHFNNYIVANHEFMHTPPFRSKWLTLIMDAISSVTLFYWMSLIEDDHTLHHRYNNDPKHGGTTKDPTSTYLHGKDGKQEHVVPYILKNFFRANMPVPLFETARRVWNRKSWARRNLIAETIILAATVVIVISINPYFLIAMFVFSYIGWILTDLQNYYEHYRAGDPESRFANSVSHYGKFYNFLTFNEGYHQEHHLKPRAHWTERPALREKYAEEMREAGHYASLFRCLSASWTAILHPPLARK